MTQCPQCNGVGFMTYGKWSTQYDCDQCFGTGQAMQLVKYAGIGSRNTPMPVMQRMELIATLLAVRGIVLRSGHAKGADTAFEEGCKKVKGRKVIRTASGIEPWLAHAAMFHPEWNKCNDSAKRLHARNSAIVLGDKLNDPVNFIVCWTDGGGPVGGTGQALRIAPAYGIPVFNLWFDDAESKMWKHVG